MANQWTTAIPHLEDRFLAKVDRTDDCWLWLGAKTKGYGTFSADATQIYAHRWSYEQAYGRIPVGLELDHLCRTPACVRPDHLEAVTHQENARRGLTGVASGAQQRAKTHCAQGHAYDELNTGYRPNGRRRCRACGNAYNRLRRQLLAGGNR